MDCMKYSHHPVLTNKFISIIFINKRENFIKSICFPQRHQCESIRPFDYLIESGAFVENKYIQSIQNNDIYL